MKAVGFDTYGGPEVLHLVELPEPHARTGEVRVRVAAAGVAPVDAMARTGLMAPLYEGLEPPYVPGMEVAGVVDEIGEGVDRPGFSLGARVMAFVAFAGSWGGYSEVLVLPADSVVTVPEGISLHEAATLVMNPLTAINCLDGLGLAAGDTLLITGAGGTVGTYLTQLAHRAGLRVVALANTRDEERVRDLGAEWFVPRGSDLAAAVRAVLPEGVDGAVDAAILGAPVLGAVRDGGQIAALRVFHGEPERGITVTRLTVRTRATDRAALAQVRDAVADGLLRPRIAKVLPAADAVEAHRLLDRGGLDGRLVLEFPVR